MYSTKFIYISRKKAIQSCNGISCDWCVSLDNGFILATFFDMVWDYYVHQLGLYVGNLESGMGIMLHKLDISFHFILHSL